MLVCSTFRLRKPSDESATSSVIKRFFIPVVFFEITKVECVYWSNTTIFVGRI